LGFEVEDFGFRVWNLGLRFEFGVKDLRFGIQGLGFGVEARTPRGLPSCPRSLDAFHVTWFGV
jgi:hypothetical protein